MLFVFSNEKNLKNVRIEDPSGMFRPEFDASFAASFAQPKGRLDFGLGTFETKAESEIDKVLFHIVNLTGLHHRDSASSFGGRSTTSMSFNGEGWKLKLQAASPATTFNFGGLKLQPQTSSGGGTETSRPEFAVTYFGILEREDESSFSTDEATDLIEGLYYFFSFVRGAWCWPCAYVGLRSSAFCWLKCLQVKDITPMKPYEFYSFTGSEVAVSASFEGFLKFWKDADWRTPLKAAISWAVDGKQSRSIESSLVGGQTALELISWIQLVDRERIVSMEGFDKLPAADRLRLLLTLQKVSTALSSTTPELTAYCLDPNRKWDGPRVLTELRNSIIHPRRRETLYRASEAVRRQARALTESYLSFTLLRLFGYTGELPEHPH